MGRESKRRARARLWGSGAAALAGAALLSKLIGVLQKVPLQNLAGDRVFGIFNAVYPFYQLIAVMATAGIPAAVSIVVAGRLKDGSGGERSAAFGAALLLAGSGLAAAALMWLSAESAALWIGDAAAAPAIRATSLALLAAPLAAALRGYAQGCGKMALSASSQVIEQLVRVAVMVLALAVGLKAGWREESIAAAVMTGSAAGASAALLPLGLFGWRMRGRGGDPPAAERATQLLRDMKELAVFAFPAALAAAVVPALGVMDAFTVPRLLLTGGRPAAEAMSLFGVYSRAQPVVQLAAMMAGAAAAALVPGMVLARKNLGSELLRLRLMLLLRAAWALGAAAALGLVLLAEPINVMLYADAKGTAAFALIGCTALAACANGVVSPALQALGSARMPAALLLLAALLKGALNAALVPSLGIEGAALAGAIALTAAALAGTAAVRYAAERAVLRAPQSAMPRGAGVVRPAAAIIAALTVMAAAVMLAERVLTAALGTALPPRAAAAALALTGAAVGACAFAVAALRCGAIGAREWRALPGGAAWAARLRRRRLLPPASGRAARESSRRPRGRS